jgi:hypothetical protein
MCEIQRGRGLASAGIAVLSVWFFVVPAFGQNFAPQIGQPLPAGKNDAGVRIDVLPDSNLAVGTKARFRITATQAGYLMVIDVNAIGKVSQIYPNADYVLTEGAAGFSNQLKPGQAVTIPEPGNPYTGFVFIVSPPGGIAMSLAILCDQPVQVLDLPDVPASMVGRTEAIEYLANATRSLQIAIGNASARSRKPNWAFGATFYRIE